MAMRFKKRATAERATAMTEDKSVDGTRGIGSQVWGVLKSALTEEDPIASARRAKLQAGRPATDATAPRTATRADDAATVAVQTSPMAEALLAQVLSKATAYTALTEKLKPLEGIVVDERTRYQAAYALIRSSRSVEQVVQSIDMQHLQAVDAEAGRFAAQLQEKERAEIGSRSEEARTLTTNIEAADRQIAELRQAMEERIHRTEAAMAKDRDRLAQLAQEIAGKRRELNAVQQQFDEAARAVREALSQAKTKVLGYLT